MDHMNHVSLGLCFRKGSVIAEFTIDYKYIDREQLVQIADLLEETKMLGSLSISSYNINSTASKYYFIFIVS